MTNAAEHAHLCPGCFADKGNASLCPQCGYDENLKRGPLVLPHRTLLHHGQYLIGKVLGKPGGFGITYLALDTKLQTRVAIKEYLPRDLAGRDAGHATISAHSAEDGEFFRYGLTQFLQEARTLAQFDHANIVRVRNFFEENSTGYLVMDYYDGITLADYLAQQPQGKLPEQTAVAIMMPILDGLREVHARNILHRDIKPQNIYLTTANRPILLDFGAARQAMGERSRSLSVVLSEGYAPYEQYHRRGEQGPWTDIYACAAVLYHAVSGEAPPPATERMHKDELDIAALGISASLTEALRSGLAADHHKRPQKMTEFQGLLLGGDEAGGTIEKEKKPKKDNLSAPAKQVAPRPIEPTRSKNPSFLTMLFRLALAVVVLILIGMLAVFINGERKTEADQQAAAEVDRQQQLNKEVAAENARQEVQRKTAIEAMEQRVKAEQQASAKLVEKPITILNQSMNFGKTEKNELIQLLRRMDAASVDLIRKMADRGSPAEQTILGYMYANGTGITKNQVEAVRWYRKAADQDYGLAQLAFAFNSKGGAEEKIRWLRKAAENGNASAQFICCMISSAEKGKGNDAEAFLCIRKAAEQGNALAQYITGAAYAEGKVVTKDDAEAVRWYRKAAEQGDVKAKTELKKLGLQ